MGTLSGGGKEKITIGKNCLIGANAGTGISLGDNCEIEAGTYIKDSTKVLVEDVLFGESGQYVKAAELSGKSDMMFYRCSVQGNVRVKKSKRSATLNSDLHTN